MNGGRYLGLRPGPRRGLPGAVFVAALVAAVALAVPLAGYAQGEGPAFEVKLATRTFTPAPGISKDLAEKLSEALGRGETRHVYVQLKKHLREEERAALAEAGVTLLSYIGSYTWYATVTDRRALAFTSPEAVKATPILETIRSIEEIRPADRVAPELDEEKARPWIETEEGRERYSVYFFDDVSMEEARRIISGLGGTIEEEDTVAPALYATVPPAAREALTNEDRVMYIDLFPPPRADENDGSRAFCGTDAVHTAGRTGTNVVLGIWESGDVPERSHVDLTAARLNWEETPGVDAHATHVCGTMVGTGTGTVPGNPNRSGHAPGVNDVRCYDATSSPGEMGAAVTNFGVVAANHSWGYTTGWAQVWDPVTVSLVWQFEPWDPQTFFGDYRFECSSFDELVRERGLVIVKSAGNDRNDPGVAPGVNTPGDWDQVIGPGSWDGYHTVNVPGTAKNVITVGAVDDWGTMAAFSNWGPTDDGRIKPDVVAPGVDIWSCWDTDLDGDGVLDDYERMSGTSMAAPAVTGIVGLLIQSYREDYLGVPGSDLTPLPSTIKALLCHSAADLGDPGPDYRFGYGGVQADAARQLIVDNQFLEGVVLANGDVDVYEVDFDGSDPNLRITLAWDDAEATGVNPNPALRNDLDLVVQDPNGIYYTPWHLHITADNQVVNPATRNTHNVASTAAIPVAARDRWNNVEQVFVDTALVGGALPVGTWKVIVEVNALPEAPQRYSLVSNANYKLHGEVDVVQVLDNSGSMAGLASSGSTDPKIKVLRDAANHFVDMMLPDEGHQLGLVKFSTTATTIMNLQPLKTAAPNSVSAAHTAINALTATNMTSIGDGLGKARVEFNASADPSHDSVILLVTDGMENTAPMISAVQQQLINDNIVVYPLGLGYSSGINEDKLTDLAEKTGGSYRITADNLIFRKFFIEILAGAVDWSVVTDPIAVMNTPTALVPVTLTGDEIGATFTAYWEGADDAINLTLITPSGLEIDPMTGDPRIRYFDDHPRYAFYQLDFPLGGSLAGEWAGVWQMKLTRTGGGGVRYAVSAFAEKGAELDIEFDKLSHLTGDKVQVTARLTHHGRPITGARINVHGDVPKDGVGNILFRGEVDPGQLQDDLLGPHGDSISKIEQKLSILAEQAGKDILERVSLDFELYDDGAHGDGGRNDGTYGNSFRDTRIPGSYTFRFVASNVRTGDGPATTREWTKSFYNEVNVKPRHCVFNLTHLAKVADGHKFGVKFAPRDRFGNYFGPGHKVSVVSSEQGDPKPLKDNVDGTYTADITLTQGEVNAGANLMIIIDGAEFANFGKKKWTASLHAGYPIPYGTFGNDFDAGFNVLVDVGYRLKPWLSLVFLPGYNTFKAKTAGFEDTYWINLSLNAKYAPLVIWPYSFHVNGGPGYYIPKDGDGKFGFNLGFNTARELDSTFAVEAGADYHTIIEGMEVYDPAATDAAQFLHLHVGAVVSF